VMPDVRRRRSAPAITRNSQRRASRTRENANACQPPHSEVTGPQVTSRESQVMSRK
jgi:hypothetical protein